MNKIYKVIWNQATSTWTAVAEIATGRGKQKSSRTAAAGAQAAEAQPKGLLKPVITGLLLAFLPMSAANAYIAIGGTNTSGTAVQAAGYSLVNGVLVYHTAYTVNTGGGGDSALNYNNPGSLSYADASTASTTNLYTGTLPAASGIAIGTQANAVYATDSTRASGIAIGDYSKASSGLTLALGHYAIAEGIGGTAIGTASRASGFNSLAIMRQSAATASYAMAIGSVAYASGVGSLAVGQSATASGTGAIAIGSAEVELTSASTTYWLCKRHSI